MTSNSNIKPNQFLHLTGTYGTYPQKNIGLKSVDDIINEYNKNIPINFSQPETEQSPFVKLSIAQNNYDNTESALKDAKSVTADAQTNMTKADDNVKKAETALAEAKNKTVTKTDKDGKTTKEPDKDAITAAEKKLEEAKAKQTDAQKKLEEAQNKEKEAQVAFDTANEELEKSRKEFAQAQKETENIENAKKQETQKRTFDTGGNENVAFTINPNNTYERSPEGLSKDQIAKSLFNMGGGGPNTHSDHS